MSRPSRWACAEPLEGRRLLSALAVPAAPAIKGEDLASQIAAFKIDRAGGAFKVVSLNLASEDNDGDIPVAASALPAGVIATLHDRFPGARVIDAAFNTEDGGPEYGVSAVFNGRLLDVNLTPTGAIIETGQILTSGEVPSAVLAWVGQNFPGAKVGEAAVVSRGGELNIELVIAPENRQDVEATLRVNDMKTPVVAEGGRANDSRLPAFESAPDVPGVTVETGVPVEARASEAPMLDDLARSATPSREQSSKRPTADRAAPPARESSDVDWQSKEEGGALDAGPAIQAAGASPAVAAVVRAVGAAAGPIAWVPEVAGMLSDVLPADVGAVELGLRGVLGEIDSLAGNIAVDATWHDVALRLALATALFAGADLILRELRRARGRNVLVYDAATASWTWVPAPATPRRHAAHSGQVQR